MADFAEIIKTHCGEDGTIPADAIARLTKAITTAVGNEFVDKTRYKAKLEEIGALKTDKQTAEDSAATAEKWKNKYEALKLDFESYKGEQAAKETKAAKESAARAFYESKNITGRALEIAMRGSTAEIAALELDGDKIKDTAALEALVKGDFSDLVRKIETKGADVAHPPANTGVGSLTKSDIYKKDDKGRYIMDAAERQNALAKMMSENQT